MTPDPHLFLVFGATGDLARRKLLPAVSRLTARGHLGSEHVVLGVSRDTDLDDEGFRSWARQALEEAGPGREALARWCDRCLHYQPLDGDRHDHAALARRVAGLERRHGLPGHRLFYLAVPPAAFPSVVAGLGGSGLSASDGWTRLVVEKPFGRDEASARELNATLHRWFDESQVFRIDHYLGKETVQNLLVFRFANPVFASHWSHRHIERVEITVAERDGIGGRAGYYDRVGALRDMIQNHLTQILALVAMEAPGAFEAEEIHRRKLELLRSVRRPRPSDAVLGRYEAGRLDGEGPGNGSGEDVRGYRDEVGVADDSRTETFAALRLEVQNPRWRGTPFVLRTGKRLARDLTEVTLTFRRPSAGPFTDDGAAARDVLRLVLQPDEGFTLEVDVKQPGGTALAKVPLDFRYREAFGPLDDAYVTLLLDALDGDRTLFVPAAEAEAAWRLYAPLLEDGREPQPYAAGSWGPRAAEALLADDGERLA